MENSHSLFYEEYLQKAAHAIKVDKSRTNSTSRFFQNFHIITAKFRACHSINIVNNYKYIFMIPISNKYDPKK